MKYTIYWCFYMWHNEMASKRRSPTSYRIVMCDKNKALDAFPKLLSETGFEPEEYDLVLIKPNFCGMYYPETSLIEKTIEFFEPRARKIVIGETKSMIHTPERQFKRFRLYDMIKRFGEKVMAMDLMEDDILDLEIPFPHAVSKLPIPKLVKECDLLINIPKVGKHSDTLLTCALKNLFGLLAEGNKYGVYHPLGVDNVIADLMKVVRCDLNIVDAGEKVIVGVDPLTVDALACRFVGLNPLKVRHLRLVSEDRGLKLEDVLDKLQIVEI